jgi:hypothetical protein
MVHEFKRTHSVLRQVSSDVSSCCRRNCVGSIVKDLKQRAGSAVQFAEASEVISKTAWQDDQVSLLRRRRMRLYEVSTAHKTLNYVSNAYAAPKVVSGLLRSLNSGVP